MVSVPDYLGYGASKVLLHSYEHAASLTSASTGMLRATREFCQQQRVSVNGKNFLLGYFEGGYAMKALHKLLGKKYAVALPVTASAGAYHKSDLARYILEASQPLNPEFLHVGVAYLRPYLRTEPTVLLLLTRTVRYAAAVNPFAAVSKQQSQLFAPAFRQAALNSTDAPLAAALADNDIYDWKLRTPMALFHDTADDYVPFFHSQDDYDAIQKRHANATATKPSGNHFSTAESYTLEAFAFISQH